LSGPGRRTLVSLLRVRDADALQQPAPWRNLMLKFGPESFEMTIHDVQLFVATTHGESSSPTQNLSNDIIRHSPSDMALDVLI